MEKLEARVCLATHVWSGAASDVWSDPANWSSGGSPNGDNSAVIVFPAVSANLSNRNNLRTLRVSQIQFDGTGYTVTGNPITLNAGGSILSNGDKFTTNTFNPRVSLAGTAATFGAQGRLNLGGSIGGGAAITKTGPGSVSLASANNFTNNVFVNQGTLNISNAKSLGGTVGTTGTFVKDGATLEIQGDISVVGERLHLGTFDFNGAGITASLRNVSGINTWTGPINVHSNAVINTAEDTKLLVSGKVQGVDGDEFQAGDTLTKSGKGTLKFSGSNTYDAFTDVTLGTLVLSNTNGLGSSAVGTRVKTGGTLALNVTPIGGGEFNGVEIGNEALELNGPGAGNTGALRSLVIGNAWAGVVTLATDARIGVLQNASLDLRGKVTGSGGVTKVSPGTLIYSGPVANDYSGITQVSNGTLLVNKVLSGSTVRVSGQATVGGTGTTSAITMQNGILSPGVTSTDTAILRAQGNIVISSTSNVDISINGPTAGTNFDQVLVTGSVTINNATLRVKGTGGAINSSFVILQGSAGITGTFNGLAENAEFLLSSGARMRINYNATQVTLTRVA